MNKILKILIIGAAVPIALAACENPPHQPRTMLSPSFGDAVHHNMAVQIINPEGSQDFGPTPMDGDRANIAVKRYRTDTTKGVVEQRTAEVGARAK